MMNSYSKLIATIALWSLAGLLAACQSADETSKAGSADKAVAVADERPTNQQRSPDKPGPPIAISYTIIGTPVVGQPVEVDVKVSSSVATQSLRVNYDVMDPSSLFFPDTQPRDMIYTEVPDDSVRSQRITVVPQVEGRLYLNVVVEVDTEFGLFTKTAAIPVQVGSVLTKPKLNGELQTDEQGEAVISMPAKED